ncbi:amidohydrolase family protein [Streptomyces sp. NPDC086787]|uniref:amidohydrolase family protein n=1 Tax=Streptomyces sp. NPDC086787 TaxID=3365759 RepID=UPI00381E6B1B
MRVDVHAHYYPTAYLDLLDRYGGSETGTQVARGPGGSESPSDLAERFTTMDQNGVDMQVLSITPQAPYLDDRSHAVELAGMINDLYADIVRQYPDRLAAFGIAPLPHVDDAVAEVSRCLDDLHFMGMAINTEINGRSIADPRFEPWWAALNEHSAVCFIHPAGSGLSAPLIVEHSLTWPIGSPYEDTMAVMHLILADIPNRYPRIKFITGHLGGVLPFLSKRLDIQSGMFMPSGKQRPSEVARGMWYDTVNGNGASLRCAVDAFGESQFLLGSDYPHMRGENYRLMVEYIKDSGLTSQAQNSIYADNAWGILSK